MGEGDCILKQILVCSRSCKHQDGAKRPASSTKVSHVPWPGFLDTKQETRYCKHLVLVMYPASFLAWLSMCWLCTCLLYPLGAHSNCDPFACCVSLLSIIRICLSSCCLGSSLNYLSSHHHLLMDSVSISVFSIYVIWSLWEVDGRFVWSWPAVSTHPPRSFFCCSFWCFHTPASLSLPFIPLTTFLLHISTQWPY